MPHSALLADWIGDLVVLCPGVDRAAARRSGADLLDRWAEPHRGYHTRQHLTEMLTALDALAATAVLDERDLHLAHVAAWLHDAVYDVTAPAGDSERESAQFARNVLVSLDVGSSDIQRVEGLILLTVDHGTQRPGALADAFIDADLAILAATPERFDEYCAQVRAEYAHVPDTAYATARSEILSALVDRPQVYRTAFAREAWTANARANVAREIGRLRVGE